MAATAIGIALAATHPALASRPACGNTSASPVLATSSTFEKSEVVIEQGLTGTANVLVNIDDYGIVRRALMLNSTGYALLDNEALRVAQSMRFVPQDTCRAIGGSYSVVVDFKD